MDSLGFVYELVGRDRHEDTYVRLLYRLLNHKSKIERLDLSELVNV